MRKLFIVLLFFSVFAFTGCLSTEEMEEYEAANYIDVHIMNECAWSMNAGLEEKGFLTFRENFELGHNKDIRMRKNTQYTLYLQSRFDFEEVSFKFTTKDCETTYIIDWDSFDGKYHLLIVK